MPSSPVIDRFLSRARQPVALDSVAIFRMVFGAIMFWEVVRYFQKGWIQSVYIDPPFHFTYLGFGWVRPLPEMGMYLVFLGLGLASAGVFLGLFYRAASLALFLGNTYLFLIEKAVYLNHAYLICLISFLMIFLPAAGQWSFDASQHPRLRRNTVPAGALWLLRFQIALPYVYGGIAKLTPDWLKGQPMNLWLMREADRHPSLSFLAEREAALFMSYGGLLFDLLIVPLLLWKPTRRWAFGVAVLFHLMNALLFHIGVFPWLMICATTLFFPPDWPRRWLRTPVLSAQDPKPAAASPQSRFLIFAGIWCLVQLLVPLRHWLYPSDVNWSEEGYRFSWRMMLNEKVTAIQFVYRDPVTGRFFPHDPSRALTPHQVQRMSQHPDMLQEYALFLAKQNNSRGEPAEIRALVLCSLNGRKPQLLVDPQANLAEGPRSLKPVPWIQPLHEPLPAEPWLIPPPKWPHHLKIQEAQRLLVSPDRSSD